MKNSFKGLFVVLAIVMSFVLVQGVYARDLDDFEVATYEGVVTNVNATTRAIELGTYPNYKFDQMGPLWYWDDVLNIPYPTVGDEVEIDAFYIDCLGVYVGVRVCYTEGKCIPLRDYDTLKPLWDPEAKMTDLSDTSAETTGDGEPNEPKDNTWDNGFNKLHDYGEQGPHGRNGS